MNFTVEERQVGNRLDKLVVQEVPGLGRAAARKLFSEGRVRVSSGPDARAHRAAKGDVAVLGQVVSVEIDPGWGIAAVPDPDAPLTVLLETEHIIVVDKPAGQPTAPLEPGERGTVANALLARYPELSEFGFSPREPGLCHRLDTDTSGLVLAARTQVAFDTLTAALKQGQLDKRYYLVCEAADLPERGTIEIPLAPHPKDRRRVHPCVHERDMSRNATRPASTVYRTVGTAGRWALVEARISRALRHQIRVHFAAIGHPLAADSLYGGPEVEGLTRQGLHAFWIAYKGDASVPAFTARSVLPPDMAALVPEPAT